MPAFIGCVRNGNRCNRNPGLSARGAERACWPARRGGLRRRLRLQRRGLRALQARRGRARLPRRPRCCGRGGGARGARDVVDRDGVRVGLEAGLPRVQAGLQGQLCLRRDAALALGRGPRRDAGRAERAAPPRHPLCHRAPQQRPSRPLALAQPPQHCRRRRRRGRRRRGVLSVGLTGAERAAHRLPARRVRCRRADLRCLP